MLQATSVVWYTCDRKPSQAQPTTHCGSFNAATWPRTPSFTQKSRSSIASQKPSRLLFSPKAPLNSRREQRTLVGDLAHTAISSPRFLLIGFRARTSRWDDSSSTTTSHSCTTRSPKYLQRTRPRVRPKWFLDTPRCGGFWNNRCSEFENRGRGGARARQNFRMQVQFFFSVTLLSHFPLSWSVQFSRIFVHHCRCYQVQLYFFLFRLIRCRRRIEDSGLVFIKLTLLDLADITHAGLSALGNRMCQRVKDKQVATVVYFICCAGVVLSTKLWPHWILGLYQGFQLVQMSR